MSRSQLIVRYSAFAIFATLANLGLQRLILSLGAGTVIFALALGCGTLIGLVIKYVLDKRWIFFDQSTGVRAHSRKFSLYSVMGLITTAIFWGIETAFWLIWQSDVMTLLGGAIGLTIGYVVKYHLDRRFVFVPQTLEAAS